MSEHVPVLLEEVLQMARESAAVPRLILDGTFGRGGHTQALLKEFSQSQLLALDCDADAIAYGRDHFAEEIRQERIYLLHANFSDIEKIQNQLPSPFKNKKFDLILLDLGVSSPQLDTPERGFSFYHQGPLDMRMDHRQETTAADIVNTWSAEELAELFRELGEVNRPQRVVSAIVEKRREQPFATTVDLSRLIERVEGWSRKGHHPATRFFLALRLRVNRELERIEEIVPVLIQHLSEGGRLLIITFHSLEDRIVKNVFKSLQDQGRIVTKKVVQAQWQEKKGNPRARSAKLRVFERGGKHESSAGE